MKYIDDPKLLELRFSNGMLILPFFYGKIMARLNDQTFSNSGLKKISKIKRILCRLKGLRKFKLCKVDLVCLSNTRWESQENGKWKNIQHGYYFDLFPKQTLLLENTNSSYEWKTFDTHELMSTASEMINLTSEILSDICYRLFPVQRDDYNRFHESFQFVDLSAIKKAGYVVRFQHILWKCFFKITKPKVILLHCGSYGSIPGVICKTAHELGIIPIDTQHGQVYQHKIYSASDTLTNSREYMEYMPDYFYSYGKFWSDCVDWKYEKIEVGNPHLNEFVNKYSSIKPADDMLVISQPTEKEQQHIFIKRLSKIYPDKVIRVRLHPYENLDVEKAVFLECSNVLVSDSSVNLYKDMCSSKIVIGWCSTCLSELLAFGRIPIIVNTSLAKTFPKDLGRWINSPEEIMLVSEDLKTDIDYTEYWFQDFEQAAKSHLITLLN